MILMPGKHMRINPKQNNTTTPMDLVFYSIFTHDIRRMLVALSQKGRLIILNNVNGLCKQIRIPTCACEFLLHSTAVIIGSI